MADITHRIAIKAPASKVHAALSTAEGIAGWWTRETTGVSRPGGAITVVFRSPDGSEKGRMAFELARLRSDHEVRWRFDAGPTEWLGTEVTFELSEDGDHTVLLFGHRNWREQGEFMAHCSMKWATFLLSLRAFVETGKGRPAPDDLKIDNWN